MNICEGEVRIFGPGQGYWRALKPPCLLARCDEIRATRPFQGRILTGGKDMAPTKNSEPAVSVRGLWKVFGGLSNGATPSNFAGKNKAEILAETGAVVALRDVEFDVAKGETFVVMGLSGSGKSTLVRCLIRLIDPTEGQILVGGEDILNYSAAELIQFRRSKVAMVFQHFGLLPHRSVLENAGWGLEVQGIDKEERVSRSRDALALVGLEGWENYRTSALSGGMQQRVGLARAMAADPDILLMDEPFSGLDPLIRRDMQAELVTLQGQMKKTIIFITHDLNEAVKLGSRVAIMRDGAVVQIGTPEEIIQNPADEYVAEFTRDVRRTAVLTVGSIARKPKIALKLSDSPQQAKEKIALAGGASLFVEGGPNGFVGTARIEDVQAAQRREDSTIEQAVTRDVQTIAAGASIESALPQVHAAGVPVPVVGTRGRFVGEIDLPTIVAVISEEVLVREGVDSNGDAATVAGDLITSLADDSAKEPVRAR